MSECYIQPIYIDGVMCIILTAYHNIQRHIFDVVWFALVCLLIYP